MSNAIERRTVLTMGGKFTHVNIIDGGKAVEVFWLIDEEYLEKYFHLANLSTLSVDDEFLKYEPETNRQLRFKKMLIKAIKSGVSDILVSRMDPSSDENGNICFKAGEMPAVGKSPNWWKKAAENFLPERGSRLGTTNERIAFLGLLIKKTLIEEYGYTVSDAWNAVCDQSKDLGHYWESKNSKYNCEPTGSRQVGVWYDLANTCKITRNSETSSFQVQVVGGSFDNYSDNIPLANIYNFDGSTDGVYYNSTGWIVLSN